MSPSELVLGRLVRTCLPMSLNHLRAKADNDISKLINRRLKYKQHYDQNSVVRSEFKVGGWS